MDAIEALIDHVDSTPGITGVVITSGKPSFLAGADLDMVLGFANRGRTDTEEQMFALCGRLGRLFLRIETSRKPWVAAVNGTALGGGLELALACRARLVGDDSRYLIGLPEIRWGLLPGAGGTQRLPRTIGFKAGMSLLLSGRSLNPSDAVAAGIFERVVPSADLVGEARVLAHNLREQTYAVSEKFPYHNETGIPTHSADAIHVIAREHGVSDMDLKNYPAYSAIINCVLLGAGKPLAEASTIEMREFLKLMSGSVAGNMVRTLFLNRQKADHKFASSVDLRIERIGVGEFSAPCWRDALAKSRLSIIDDPALPQDTIEIIDTRGRCSRVVAVSLATTPSSATFSKTTALLSPDGPYGRVLEIVCADDASAEILVCLARQLAALPHRTEGGKSLLTCLSAASGSTAESLLDAQALEALKLAAQNLVPDLETLDVAACVAGITPPYTGGPFNRLWQQRERLKAGFSPSLARAWVAIEPRLQEAHS
jgi:3-hydroxyacyl-CoA dehydrogenase/enoyl-CoA hydratase/3-hydroxybutyryl-CoA epimerase